MRSIIESSNESKNFWSFAKNVVENFTNASSVPTPTLICIYASAAEKVEFLALEFSKNYSLSPTVQPPTVLQSC